MKLEQLITPFKVGMLVIAGVAATLFMLSVLDTGADSSDEIQVYAILKDATGLAEKSFVSIAGINVGRIESIRLADGKARINITVRKDIPLFEGIQQPDGTFKNGASAQVKQVSFIGDYFIELTPGFEGRQLQDGDELKNVISATDLDEMMSKFNDIASNIDDVTRSLAEVFGSEEGKESMRQLLKDLRNMVDTLNVFVSSNSPKLDRILDNVEEISVDLEDLSGTSKESINNILRDTEAVVQEVRYIVGQSSSDLQSGLGTLKGTLSRLQSTLDSLNYSLQNIQDITDKINEGEGTIGELVNNPAIAQRTEEILNDASDYLGRVSRLRTIIELRSEYHVGSRQFKNIVGLRLQPNDEKYYLIELVDDYRGKTTIVTTDVNTTNLDDPDGLYRETKVETTDSFKFSVQFARIFRLTPYFATAFRFGLIESSGGVGTNLLFLTDSSLEIQADLFDFGVDVNPRVRAFAAYHFFEVLYVAGGVDDIFNDNRTEYFMGAGLRFDDEDLKAILGTTGVPVVQ